MKPTVQELVMAPFIDDAMRECYDERAATYAAESNIDALSNLELLGRISDAIEERLAAEREKHN